MICVDISGGDDQSSVNVKALEFAAVSRLLWGHHCLEPNKIGLFKRGVSYMHVVQVFNQLKVQDKEERRVGLGDAILTAMDEEGGWEANDAITRAANPPQGSQQAMNAEDAAAPGDGPFNIESRKDLD